MSAFALDVLAADCSSPVYGCSPAVLNLSNDAVIRCDSVIDTGGPTDDALDGCLCSESKKIEETCESGRLSGQALLQ